VLLGLEEDTAAGVKTGSGFLADFFQILARLVMSSLTCYYC
jgi:hypothetical protein